MKDIILKLLKSEGNSPFQEYRMNESFVRSEFQQRGSPHVHGKGRLHNDPKEPVSKNMPKTINLIDSIISSDSSLLENPKNQFHRYSFTC